MGRAAAAEGAGALRVVVLCDVDEQRGAAWGRVRGPHRVRSGNVDRVPREVGQNQKDSIGLDARGD